jgi:fructose-specific phosphotransferase system IIA component
MIITEHLNLKAISVNLKANTKEKALRELTELLIASNEIKEKDKDEIVKVLSARESIGSTGIGYSVAIPHGKSSSVESVMLAIGYSKEGIDFESIDSKPVHLFFLLLTSPEHGQLHLKVLARLSRFLKDRFFRDSLVKAKTADDIYKAIEDREKKDKVQ